jgi:tricorn protease
MNKIIFPLIAFFFFAATVSIAQTSEETLLLRHPSASDDHIAFAYASDIWVVGKNGENPRRLTFHDGVEMFPVISPNGQWVAFSGNYDGNLDVFVVPVQGGAPRRITWHPGDDFVRGWRGDNAVIFASDRESHSTRFTKLFEASLEGGTPKALAMPEVHQGAVSPDGRFTAYIKNPDPTESRGTYRPFKHYRGGNAPRIWIFDNSTYEIEEIPSAGAINTFPVWAGNTVYFLSDRNGTTNVFSFDRSSKNVRQVTNHKDFDVKTLHSNGKELTYEQGGRIHIHDIAGGKSKALNINLHPNLPFRAPRYVEVGNNISSFGISSSGKRAVIEARGEILTVPTEKGDVRNITQSPGASDRSPSWSPDGQWIAWWSDASGEYQLMLSDQKGEKAPQAVPVSNPTFFYDLHWSPDSKKLVFSDKNYKLYIMDVDSKQIAVIDQDTYSHPAQAFNPSWSPDSKWVAYARMLDNQLKAVFLYEVSAGKTHRITDGMSQADHPAFSRDGKHLFFTASTNYGLNVGWLDMSNYERDVVSSIYAVVLDAKAPSPLAPESDEEEMKKEEPKDEKKDEKSEDAPKDIRVDLAGIDQRIVALPMPARVYFGLSGLAEGKLFYQEQVENQPGATLHFFDLKKRKAEVFMTGVNGYKISADGKKLIYGANGGVYGIVDAKGKASVGDGKLNLNGAKVYVDPEKEWRQIFNEVWRIERDYFYVENLHGADWPAMKKKYEPFLAHVGHREDLNYLLAEMMSELAIGHNYVGSGDFPKIEKVNVGLLGADYRIQNGFYQISRIYGGLNWNPDFRAPLTEPGVTAAEGDYLLAVNGQPLNGAQNIYQLFRNTAGKQTVLTLNSQPTMTGAREATVVPIENESNLRNMAWVEGNRKKVEEMTDGRVAYVYLPNTGGGGYTFFNRYYFSQLDREGVIIDERFNGGGSAADYIIDLLDRELMNYWGTRSGKPQTTPMAAIFGPKAMIINEYAASGGDLLPFLFREKKLGELIGKRTLGILVGVYSYPQLMDGGFATAPRLGIFSKDGEWIIENEGVSPDIEVEMTPKAVIEGRDPQLEKAVEVVMKKLGKVNPKDVKKPEGPVRVKR